MLQNKLILAVTTLAFLVNSSFAQTTAPSDVSGKWTVTQTCDEIDRVSANYALPRATFTRLIWTESRFDVRALSPKGAQGIAQFMPATAKSRGLTDPYDPKQALDASASLLSDLRDRFGNFGLAAMAYNAGPNRVEKWLSNRGGLPFETRDYVAAITGQAAEVFRDKAVKVLDFSLMKDKPFDIACPSLGVVKTRFRGGDVVSSIRQPWGVQVAGNFSRTRAMRTWVKIRGRLGVAIGDVKPHLHKQRSLRGMKAKWAVRIGASNRKSAIKVCRKIRVAGGFCLVRKN